MKTGWALGFYLRDHRGSRSSKVTGRELLLMVRGCRGDAVSELVSPFQFATCKLFSMEAKKPSANPLAMVFLSCLCRNSGLSTNSDILGRGRFLLVLVLGTCSHGCWRAKEKFTGSGLSGVREASSGRGNRRD